MISKFRSNPTLGRLAANYGMAGVLVLLGIYYSWATLKPQQEVGGEAARSLAGEVLATAGPQARVLIVARRGADDAVFADTLASLLEAKGATVVAKVVGEPADARRALGAVGDAGGGVDVIAATAEASHWAVFDDFTRKFPSLAGAKLIVPRPSNWPTFLKRDNLLNVANQVVVIALLAAGLTLVIISGGIDLSVGSMVALSAVVCALLIRELGGAAAGWSILFVCSAAGVVICAIVGACSGVLVTVFRIPPFITTLAVMLIARGLAYILAEGQSIYEIPASFVWLGQGSSLGTIPNAVVLMVLVYAAAHVLMSRTTFGRYVYAVGGNAEAARLSGVRVNVVLLIVYVLSGAMAGLGGIVVASQLKSGSPTYGVMYELYAIAAVVVGGTSLAGGSGKVLGTLIGALIIAVIHNGMNLTGVESYRQNVVLGLVILGAVMLDMIRRHGWRELIRR
ncbi:MAG: ABC transporter permease [Betaproteobacteria bacterium]|nr:ABC transporter permease [Betaproteobacteria bacterium]